MIRWLIERWLWREHARRRDAAREIYRAYGPFTPGIAEDYPRQHRAFNDER